MTGAAELSCCYWHGVVLLQILFGVSHQHRGNAVHEKADKLKLIVDMTDTQKQTRLRLCLWIALHETADKLKVISDMSDALKQTRLRLCFFFFF